MKKYWIAVAVAVGLILVFCIVPVWSSNDFAYCQDHNGQYPANNSADQNSSSISPINAGARWVFGSCLSGFVNTNGVGITAVATFFLMLVTGGLVLLAFVQFSTTRAQLRAYMFPDNVGIVPGSNPPTVVILFRNFGQTPAKQVVSWANIDLIEPRHEETLRPPTVMGIVSPLTIGANGTFPKTTHFSRALTQQDIADLAAGTKGIYYYGRMEYRDTFNRKRWTNFRMAYVGNFPVNADMRFFACNGGNDAD